jgi:hypothetical protein
MIEFYCASVFVGPIVILCVGSAYIMRKRQRERERSTT